MMCMNSGIFFACIAAVVAIVMFSLAACGVQLRPTRPRSDYWRGNMMSCAAGAAITLIGLAVMVLKPQWFN